LRALERAGFFVHHQRGSHATLKHADNPVRRVTIPVHGGDLPRGTVLAIIKQTGLTAEEFMRLL